MRKVTNYHITGMYYYEKDIQSLFVKNPDFSRSNKELLEIYDEGDVICQYEADVSKVELIPEPDNQYDPDAVRCEIDGVKVGYIKSGSCARVKKLLASPDFKEVTLTQFAHGKEKHIRMDEDGDLYVDTFDRDGFVIHVSIVMDDGLPSAPSDPVEVPAADPDPSVSVPIKTKNGFMIPRPLVYFLLFLSVCLMAAHPLIGFACLVALIVYLIKTKK